MTWDTPTPYCDRAIRLNQEKAQTVPPRVYQQSVDALLDDLVTLQYSLNPMKIGDVLTVTRARDRLQALAATVLNLRGTLATQDRERAQLAERVMILEGELQALECAHTEMGQHLRDANAALETSLEDLGQVNAELRDLHTAQDAQDLASEARAEYRREILAYATCPLVDY